MERSDFNQGAREAILQRVRAAVKSPAPHRGATSDRPLFAPVLDVVERFRQEAVANYMEPIFTADSEASAEALRQVLASLPPGEIFLQDTAELRQLATTAATDRPVRWSTAGPPAESSQATVSHCEALVAMTGSILVSSGACGGRGASVVAPCHIVVARREQLLPDLESVMEKARQIAFDSSFVGLISGSSRTADIEKRLIIGAHGPRRVVVIVQG
jgi:L-lactate dehydrogenase complex protein LldG